MTPGSLLLRISLLLALVAAAQMLGGRRTSAATRHLVWVLTLTGALLLPVASSVLPPWTVIRFAVSDAASMVVESEGVPSGARPAMLPSNGSSMVTSEAAPSGAIIARWPMAAAALYTAGVLFLLGRWTAQRVSIGRLVRRSTPVCDTQWKRLVEACADRLGAPRTTRVLRSREVTVPLACGFLRGTILLPCVADSWSEERRRAVLLHELGHVARFDCLTQMTATVACALYWIHPGVWWAARRLRVEQELACDDRVLSTGTDARNYAGHLLQLAYALRSHAPSVVVGMAGSQRLEGRLVALLDGTRNRAMASWAHRIVGTLAMTVLLVPIAAATTGAQQAATTPPAQVSVTGSQDQVSESRWLANTVDDRTLRLRLYGSRSTSVTLDVRQLAGLEPAQFTNATHAKFVLKREAGSFSFEGAFVAGFGTGTYTFTPAAEFLAEVARQKLEKPAESDLRALALADIGIAYFDALGAEGYAGATVSQVVLALDHGANIDYVRAMGQAGYRLDGLDALVVLRDHGVTPQYVRELRELGLPVLSPADLVRARDHGISPDYIRGLAGIGYARLSLDELVRARDHGVSVDYATGMRDLGFASLSLEALSRARDHGVSVEYVSQLRVLGYRFTLDELTRARDHGVSAEYIQGLRARGYDKLTLDDLVRLRDQGVSTEYLDKLSGLGIVHPSIDDLVAMRDRGFPEQTGQQLYRAVAANLRQIGWHLRCASGWLEQILSGTSPTSAC